MGNEINRVSPFFKIRLLLFAAILCGCSSPYLYGQGSAAVSIHSGYRFPIARGPLNPLLKNVFMSDQDAALTPNLMSSYGSGPFSSLSFNYVSGKNIEYGLQFFYCHFPEKITHAGDPGLYYRIVYKANTMGITPLIRLNKKLPGSITPYLQFGLPLYWFEMSIEQRMHRSGEDRFLNQYHRRQLTAIAIMFGGGVKKSIKRFEISMDVQIAGFRMNTFPLSNLGLGMGILWKIN